ncbi:hypothetical protein, partial [Enterococcus faecium]
ECVVVTLFYRRDFLFSIYTKYFTLSKPCKNSFLAYLFFINICKITINFLVKRLEMSGGGIEERIFER